MVLEAIHRGQLFPTDDNHYSIHLHRPLGAPIFVAAKDSPSNLVNWHLFVRHRGVSGVLNESRYLGRNGANIPVILPNFRATGRVLGRRGRLPANKACGAHILHIRSSDVYGLDYFEFYFSPH